MTAYLGWVKDAGGRPTPQIWRDLGTCETESLKASQRFIAKLPIKPEDEGLSVDELARLYPCPT
jgi:hypothetical protein